MFKATIKLTQHTPIIHFQHQQVGATLRASEVKPKLDTFIMKKLLDKPDMADYDVRGVFKEAAKTNPQWRKWLIGQGEDEHVALDYKLRIDPAGKTQKIDIASCIIKSNGQPDKNGKKFKTKPWPLYFGNMGKESMDELKGGVIGDVMLTVFSFHNQLVELLSRNENEWLNQFFFLEKFGTRQSKGYGCFYPTSNDENSTRNEISTPENTIYFDLNITKLNDQLKLTLDSQDNKKPTKDSQEFFMLFKSIEIFYQFLRQGINYFDNKKKPLLYIKPAIFKYALNENQQWEKKSIKQYFFNSIRTEQIKTWPTSQQLSYDPQKEAKKGYVFRDLLGFSSKEPWGSTGVNGKTFTRIDKSFKIKYRGEDGEQKEKENLTRFKSPLRFHIMRYDTNGSEEITYRVWFWFEPIPSEYRNGEVCFKTGNQTPLYLELYKQFSDEKYLNLIFKQQDSNNHYQNALNQFGIDENQKNAPHYVILNNICESIRDNLNK